MSKVRTVAATIALMLCTSVVVAQSPAIGQGSTPYSGTSAGQAISPNNPSFSSVFMHPPGPEAGNMYVACWAEVASNNTAYFSPTFAASSVNVVRKEFRKVVTTQYGPVNKLQCTGKFSGSMVNEQVEKWKDSARTTNNAIIDLFADTGEEAATAPQHQSSQSVRYEHPHGFLDGIPGGNVPGNNSSGTVAGQSNFQR